jgi:hypothetical protein
LEEDDIETPRVKEGRSCMGAIARGGMLGEGQADEAVEREGEESSRAWHASEQYILRLGKDVMMVKGGSCEGRREDYLSSRIGLPH